MLTELRIGNFKAFGPTQRIPIKPLTLIFGPNSSGKSSIIHGLLLVNHAVEDGDWDVGRPKLAGGMVDLGGYRGYLHQPTNEGDFQVGASFGNKQDHQCDSICTLATIGLANVASSRGQIPQKPGLRRFTLELEGKPCLKLEADGAGKLRIAELDWDMVVGDVFQAMHEELANHRSEQSSLHAAWIANDLSSDEKTRLDALVRETLDRGSWHGALIPTFCLSSQHDFLFEDPPGQPCTTADRAQWLEGRAIDQCSSGTRLARQLDRSQADFGAFSKALGYLGPLRFRPPRSQDSDYQADETNRATGRSAWQALSDDNSITDKVNAWLALLDARCRVVPGVPVLADRAASRILGNQVEFESTPGNARLNHHDLGFGISQVLPVLAMAASSQGRRICIEQPELHLHPAMQANLGDVFIESALGPNQNTFLLETHSEHLILRILRRVRETTEGKLPKGLPPVRPEDVSVVYVKPGPEGAEVIELPVTPDGDFDRPWPGGFFAERFEELP